MLRDALCRKFFIELALYALPPDRACFVNYHRRDGACGDKGQELEIKGPGKQLDKVFTARSISCYSK